MEVRLTDSTPRPGEPVTWGSGQRWLNCSWATWAPFNGRHSLLFKKKIKLAMETKLEQIAAKARCEPKLRFTSLAHHITRDRVLKSLSTFQIARPLELMGRRWRRRRKALGDGLSQCSNPSTDKDIERRISDASISQSPENRRSARSAFRLSLTGRSSAARPKCSPPSTSKTSCHARSAEGQGWRPSRSGDPQ